MLKIQIFANLLFNPTIFCWYYGKTPSMPDNTSSSLPNLSGVVSSKVVLDHMKAMEAGHRAHSEALFSRKIREALKHKIRAQQRIFNSGDKVYYKRDQIKGPAGHCYRGPAVIIGKRGQVYWLVHQNKVLSCAVPIMTIRKDPALGLSALVVPRWRSKVQ